MNQNTTPLITQEGPRAVPEALRPPTGWTPPEDRSESVLSPLGETEYAVDLVRPGQIVVIAAEEGTGKSMSFPASWASASPSRAAYSATRGRSRPTARSSTSAR